MSKPIIEETIFNSPILTFEEAHKKVQAMNLIDSFLFDTSMADAESATIISRIILERVLNRTLPNIKVTPQKVITGIDTKFHGVRFDAHITAPQTKDDEPEITVYDIEMENRAADRPSLPKRQRYYQGLSDSKSLPTSRDYNKLPEYISVTICSYDPFQLGDMYYKSETKLTSHPDYDYNDGSMSIFLYADGKVNISPADYGKHLKDLLKFITTGETPATNDDDIRIIKNIISDIKQRPEVTTEFMKQWEREQSLIRETTEAATITANKNNALSTIRFNRKHNIPDDETSAYLKSDFNLDNDTISELFQQVNSELTSVK